MFSSRLSRIVVIGLLLLVVIPVKAEITVPSDAPLEELPASTLLYVSDYFSFVGQDSEGHVALALDNNRGRDGEAYQAEHFVVLHDERHGWMNVTGNGPYENGSQELKAIPDSTFFQFQGTPLTGMTIASEPNRLTLRIEVIPQRISKRYHGAVTWALPPRS